MGSSFSGLEIARSALVTSQLALDVTGQNIANVNTEDYTRQSADLVANYNIGDDKIAPIERFRVGSGVSVANISRARSSFLDTSVRNANSQYTATNTTLAALQDIESVLDETTNDGLNVMLNDFYNRLQDLSNNTGSLEYASLARSSAEKVTQVLNQYANQLSGIRDEQTSSLQITLDDINSTIDKINKTNDLIKDQTVRGTVSNELLDARDSYLDTLSGYMSISISAQTDGTVAVTSTGGIDVLDSTFSYVTVGDQIQIQRSDGAAVTTDFDPSSGEIKGYVDVLNGAGTLAAVGENSFEGLLYYQRSLDAFTNAFAGTYNDINTLDPLAPANLFSGTTASDIAISDEWNADVNHLVVSDLGPNDNIIKMINAMGEDVDPLVYPGMDGSFEKYAQVLMSEIGINTSYHIDITEVNENILQAASNERESITGVSIDEEVVNMTKYQKAYQAAARMMTVLDENLNTLINSMGIVGR